MRQFRVCDSVEAYGLEKALDKACILIELIRCLTQRLVLSVIPIPKKRP